MNNTADREIAFLIVRILSVAGLIVSLIAGVYLNRNFERMFGTDADNPSESAGARGYSKMQVMAVWLHAVLFFLMGSLLLH